MATTLRVALSVALLATAAATSNLSAQSNIRDRVAAAVETVEEVCAADISKFCGNVTRGEGRVILCMQAHDDQLSYRCQVGLYRASRNLDRVLNRVERIAEACWNEIETQCKDAPRIGQCVMDKAQSLSPPCQTVAANIREALQGLASLIGMPAYSADGTHVGQVVAVTRGPDGKVQSVQIDVGRFLGIGDRVVTIDSSSFEELADRVNLRLTGEAVRSLQDAKKQ
jgi:PRC-barrel domain/Cysteine rich repeat